MDGLRRWRSVLAGTSAKSVFLKKEFFSLDGLPPWRIPTISKCTFLLCGRKVPKRTHPSGGEPTDSPPLGIPPLPWGCFMGTGSPLPKSASGGKPPFGKLTASAFILAMQCPGTMGLGRLTIDAPPRRPSVRPGGDVCGTNGCWNEVFGGRFTAGMKFDGSR